MISQLLEIDLKIVSSVAELGSDVRINPRFLPFPKSSASTTATNPEMFLTGSSPYNILVALFGKF